jgi:hypothetical protein
MSLNEKIGAVFVGLEDATSLEVALTEGLRLACTAAALPAGAIVADWGPGAQRYRLQYDPEGLFDRDPTHCAGANAQDHTGLLMVRIPLRCAGHEVGRLVLLSPQRIDENPIHTRLAGITAALAVLLAANDRGSAKPPPALVGRGDFEASVAAEIARCERHSEPFSVIHVRLEASSESPDGPSPWARVTKLGGTLLARLRRTDVIGLMAPHHMAVLLVRTGRLGARIAARRVADLLNEFEDGQREPLHASCSVCRVMTFPDEAADVASLCEMCCEPEALVSAGPTGGKP